MDADAWKILIGAIAVTTSGLGGQWLAGRNSRLTADAIHKQELNRWSLDLKYKTYLVLVEQFESSFAYLARASRGDASALSDASGSVMGVKATEVRLVGSLAVRRMANEVDASFREWYQFLREQANLPSEKVDALRESNQLKFQSLVNQVRKEIGAIDN